jgi:hypothetical protein
MNKFLSSREPLLGQGIPQTTPISLDPVHYAGSLVYGDDGILYYSDGTAWYALSGANNFPTLQQVTDAGNVTTTNITVQDITANNIVANSFIIGEGTGGAIDGLDYIEAEVANINVLHFQNNTTVTWNDTDSTLEFPLNSDVTLQIGQETIYKVKAAEDIDNGDVVMFAGAQGDHILVQKANINVPGFVEAWVMGVATEDMLNNDFGFVTTFGKVRGLNTSSYTEGDILYLSSVTPGALENVEPAKPAHSISVAAVTRVNPAEGEIFVRPTWNEALGELHDVAITNVADNDLLVYDDITGTWVNTSSLSLTDISVPDYLISSSTATLSTVSQTSIAEFDSTVYGSGKYVIEARDGVNRHVCELLVTHDGTTAVATQYGSVWTSGELATYDVDISGGNVRILATSVSTNSTVYKVLEMTAF